MGHTDDFQCLEDSFDILLSKNIPSFHLLETIIYGIQLDTRSQLNTLLYFPNVLQIKLFFLLEAPKGL